MLLPLKVEVPTLRMPVVNYLLISIIIILSLVGFYDLNFFCSMAGINVSVDENNAIHANLSESFTGRMGAALGSIFLHGGYIHLIGNMWFLWVFGNALNYKLGHAYYLLLFMIAGWIGTMAHYAFTGVPAIGASGAVNGVVGAFLVFFPRNEILMAWIWGLVGIWGKTFRISSYWVILYWFAWDAFSLIIGWSSGVALWGHISGFLLGFGAAFLLAWTGLVKPTDYEQTLVQVFWPTKHPSKYHEKFDW